MSYDWIIIAYPTVMDGLVLRWYASEEAARASLAHLSASRNAVEVYIEGELAEAARPEAERAYALLRTRTGMNLDEARQLATHRWSDIFAHGELIPLGAHDAPA